MKVSQFDGVLKKSDILKQFMSQKRNELVTQELELVYLKKKSIVTTVNHNGTDFKKNAEMQMTASNNLKEVEIVLRSMEELLEEYLKEENPEEKEVITNAR